MHKSSTHQSYIRPLTMVSGFSFMTFNTLAEGYCSFSFIQTTYKVAQKHQKSAGNKDSPGSKHPFVTTIQALFACKKSTVAKSSVTSCNRLGTLPSSMPRRRSPQSKLGKGYCWRIRLSSLLWSNQSLCIMIRKSRTISLCLRSLSTKQPSNTCLCFQRI